MAAAALLTACSVQRGYKYTGEGYETARRDSVYVRDTLTRIERDTLVRVERDTLRVWFTDGGGTFDANTGVMAGVLSVERVTAVREERGAEQNVKSGQTAVAVSDTTASQRAEAVEASQKVEAAFPWWLLAIGAAAGVALVAGLRRVPGIKLLLRWI